MKANNNEEKNTHIHIHTHTHRRISCCNITESLRHESARKCIYGDEFPFSIPIFIAANFELREHVTNYTRFLSRWPLCFPETRRACLATTHRVLSYNVTCLLNITSQRDMPSWPSSSGNSQFNYNNKRDVDRKKDREKYCYGRLDFPDVTSHVFPLVDRHVWSVLYSARFSYTF